MMTTHRSQLTLPVSERDHSQGPASASVTLVEYGDYECPHCGAAYPIVQEIQRQLGERLRFVFRNFPITTAHPHAEHAAEAAEAAGGQGKFWEMHDYLFEHQQALDDRKLEEYAAAVGLDLERFDDDMEGQAYAARVREDFMSGVRSGVNGTPTFFINGQRHNGAYDVETLLAAIDAAMPESSPRVV
jgi:protein-disulfide isomerase